VARNTSPLHSSRHVKRGEMLQYAAPPLGASSMDRRYGRLAPLKISVPIDVRPPQVEE
jgi:hypothetical protein